MFKIIFALLVASTMLVANMDFDALDEIGDSTHNESQVQKDLKAFESSLDGNSIDVDKVEPAAGFEELDQSVERKNDE